MLQFYKENDNPKWKRLIYLTYRRLRNNNESVTFNYANFAVASILQNYWHSKKN